MADSVEL